MNLPLLWLRVARFLQSSELPRFNGQCAAASFAPAVPPRQTVLHRPPSSDTLGDHRTPRPYKRWWRHRSEERRVGKEWRTRSDDGVYNRSSKYDYESGN